MTSKLLTGLLLVVMIGCGYSATQLGWRALGQKDYQRAETHYRDALSRDRLDFRAWRGLGMVQYHRAHYAEAAAYLDSALQRQPTDDLSVLFRGLSSERDGDYSAAEAVYTRFLAVTESSRQRDVIAARLRFVQNESMRNEIHRAVQLETDLITPSPNQVTVAVMPFFPTATVPDSLRSLGRGLAAAVMYDLHQVKSLAIVERLRLQAIIDELSLTEAASVDPASAPRIGRVSGASHIVSSSIDVPRSDHIQLESGLVDVVDAFYRGGLVDEDQLSMIWRLQKAVTFSVIDSLGISLTAEERRALETVPTKSFEAFLAYSRGLEAYDMGNYEAAQAFFQQASEADPGFEGAQDYYEDASLMVTGGGSLTEIEVSAYESVPVEPVDFGNPEDAIIIGVEQTIDPRTDDDPIIGRGRATINGGID